MTEYNRRDFFKITGLGLAGFALGCTPLGIEDKVYDTEIEPYLNDSNPDPLFRASTIVVARSGRRGQASLVLDDRDNVYLYTLKHVASILGSEFHFFVLGIDDYILKRDGYLTYPSRVVNDDPGIFYDLKLTTTHPLKTAIEEKRLRPLILSKDKAQIGDKVAMPNLFTKGYTPYQINGYAINNNYYLLTNSQKDVVCQGQSGTPILKMEDGYVTNQVLGVVSAINKSNLVYNPWVPESKTICGDQVIVRLNG